MSEERDFLHELNNKIAIIEGRTGILLQRLTDHEKPLSNEDVFKRLQNLQVPLDEIVEIIKARRELLIKREELLGPK